MSFYSKYPIIKFSIVLICIFLYACSSRKSERKVSAMKNLTAHFNIYFNASELLNQAELNIRNSVRDDYNQQLAIFPLPEEGAKTENLNEVITKANRIALEKFESNWVDDAFLLLAKAEYWKGNYYNAAEYFSYVTLNFPKEDKNKVEALVWQARSYFALDYYKDADSVLKIAYDANLKHYRAPLNAALANAAIKNNNLDDAIKYLQKAVNFSKDKYSKIRWTYILAQLQEINNQNEDAYSNYSRVTKSNAAFEMSFNANLARIRIQENEDGKKFDKIATLKSLLKEDKNREFKDQIYYQIANAYLEENDLEAAAENYVTSAHTIPGTVKQKGLSFLRLAELNFDSLKNYAQAQLYYDSTLQSLPKTYPGYESIATKANNLQYLAERLTIIEREKELLMLANLSEEERAEFINKKISVKLEQESALQSQLSNPPLSSISDFSESNKNAGTFYFNNSAALSQGMNEFKKRWGNRKLEDNWRFSTNNLSTAIAQNVNFNGNINNGINADLKTTSENIDSLRVSFLRTIPLNDASKQESAIKIRNAWNEIALFYKDILNDSNAAITTFEQLLREYPENPQNASIYYQLFRLYEPVNKSQSDYYKNKLVEKYPTTVFAKSVTDPNFGREYEAQQAGMQNRYAGIFESYQNKDYRKVITEINALNDQLQNFSSQAPQFYYLKALAVGKTEKAPVFISSLEQIINEFPNDTIVTPLAKSQLSYIANNRSVFDKRVTALTTYDAYEEAIPEKVFIPKVADENPTIANTEPLAEIKSSEPLIEKSIVKEEAVKVPEIEKPKPLIFNTNARIKHYIVIDIKNNLNVAKPFAGLTKYFYSKFDPSKVNLTIRTIGNTDKLITISAELYTKEIAEKVSEELGVDLPNLLNLKSTEYIKFVISEPNLQMMNNKESLDQYLNYIQ